MKDNLLKIAINTGYAVLSSKTLKNWIKFDIRLFQIDNLRWESIDGVDVTLNDTRLLVDTISHIGDGTKQKLAKSSEMELQKSSENPSSQQVIFPYDPDRPYSMRFNSVSFSTGAIEFQILKKSFGKESVVGKVNIPLSDLYRHCSQDGSCWEGSFPVVPLPGGRLKSGAVLKIGAHRYPAESSYLREKKESELNRIGNVEQWYVPSSLRRRIFSMTQVDRSSNRFSFTIIRITLFNQELSPEEKRIQSLSPNIQAGRGSLLHAAIYLEDLESVRKLVTAGADPRVKGDSFVSALSLAMNMAEGQVERLGMTTNDEEERGADDDRRQQMKNARRSRQEIAEYLEHAARLMHSQLNQNDGDTDNGVGVQTNDPELPTVERLWIVEPGQRRLICQVRGVRQTKLYC